MNYKDYYGILGVSKQASKEQIKKAYRSLARKHHPDVNQNDKKAAERFKEISEAYEVLGNDENRKLYDQLGADWKKYKNSGRQGQDFNWQQWARQRGERNRQRTYSQAGGDFFSGREFSDFFEQIFGGGFGRGFQTRQGHDDHSRFDSSGFENTARSKPAKGSDIHAELKIALEEAFHGAEKSIRVHQKQMKIKIPRGIRDQQRLKLKGRGKRGVAGGEAGDLYIRVLIKPHEIFIREEDDLHTHVEVNLYDALLGGSVRVPTITGNVKIRIPAESQPGKTLRIAGHGMPVFQSEDQKGDLYVTLKVILPEKLSSKEKKLFKELSELRG